MIPVASCHWKIYLNFFHLIFSYERETVFGCRAIPPAFARRLFCCPIKGQKQVMDVEISTDRGKLWGCWLWYQFSPTRGKKGRKKSLQLLIDFSWKFLLVWDLGSDFSLIIISLCPPNEVLLCFSSGWWYHYYCSKHREKYHFATALVQSDSFLQKTTQTPPSQ